MKTLHISVLLALLCLETSGCNNQPSDDASRALTSGEWTMQSMTLNGQAIPPLAGARISISFQGNRFSGSSGCNSYDGTYATQKGGRFSIRELGGTEMACDEPGAMQLEQDFFAVMSQVQAYSVNQSQLVLSDGTAQNQIVFVPYQPPTPLPLLGTVWTLETFEESDGVSVSATPVLDQAPITLTFIEGTATGSAGCNRYDAEVAVGEGQLTFEELIMTEEGCSADIMQQEEHFSTILPKMTHYEIAGNHLQLHDPQRTLTLHFSGKR